MNNAVLSLDEGTREPLPEEILPSADGVIYVGEAECPQCGGLGDQHTRYCPLGNQ
jgi:hypothetical protein